MSCVGFDTPTCVIPIVNGKKNTIFNIKSKNDKKKKNVLSAKNNKVGQRFYFIFRRLPLFFIGHCLV